MKALSLSALTLLLSAQAMAAFPAPFKTCTASVDEGSSSYASVKFEILKDEDGSVIITETVRGQTTSSEDYVSISKYEIRAGLALLTENGYDADDSEREGADKLHLNKGEELIAKAMLRSEVDKGLSPGAGVDLNAIRSVKAYRIGPMTQLGIVSIIDAYDESGKLLGTFVGGDVAVPCK
ncbi:MAG: hypothetical protein ACJ763_04400 [Bdellovibrionia bacterium]